MKMERARVYLAAAGVGFIGALGLLCVFTYALSFPSVRYPYANPISLLTGIAAGVVFLPLFFLVVYGYAVGPHKLLRAFMLPATVLGVFIVGVLFWNVVSEFAAHIIHTLCG